MRTTAILRRDVDSGVVARVIFPAGSFSSPRDDTSQAASGGRARSFAGPGATIGNPPRSP